MSRTSFSTPSRFLLIACFILLATVNNQADGAPLWSLFRVDRSDSPSSYNPFSNLLRRSAVVQGVAPVAKQAASTAQTTLDAAQVQTLLNDVQTLRSNAVQLGNTIDTLNSQQQQMNVLLATLIKIIGPV